MLKLLQLILSLRAKGTGAIEIVVCSLYQSFAQYACGRGDGGVWGLGMDIPSASLLHILLLQVQEQGGK